jgi:hypothetical protein
LQAASTDWKTANGDGFQASFDYISGANADSVKIPMTAPVISRSNDSYNWNIGFFVPASLYPTLNHIPAPLPNSSLSIVPLPLTTFAVLEFGGFAQESDFVTNAATLRGFLARDNVQVANDEWNEVWCQFDSPFTIFNRHNQVWIHINL